MDKNQFKTKLELLYSIWEEYNADVWQSTNVLVACSPARQPSGPSKSAHFFNWLFGQTIFDTTIIMTRRIVHIFCPDELAVILRSVDGCFETGDELQVHVQGGGKGYDEAINLIVAEDVMPAIKNGSEKPEIVIGTFGLSNKAMSFLKVEKVDVVMAMPDVTEGYLMVCGGADDFVVVPDESGHGGLKEKEGFLVVPSTKDTALKKLQDYFPLTSCEGPSATKETKPYPAVE